MSLLDKAMSRKWRWAGHIARLNEGRLAYQIHWCRNSLCMAAASALRCSFRRVRGLHRFGTDWAARRWESAVEKHCMSKWGDWRNDGSCGKRRAVNLVLRWLGSDVHDLGRLGFMPVGLIMCMNCF